MREATAQSPSGWGTDAAPVDTLLEGNTDTTAAWRWLDVAGQPYSTSFQDSYTYETAVVRFNYNSLGTQLVGNLSAAGLKPNFAYQLKFYGTPGNTGNELLGYNGRWWQEEWDGSNWTGGQNLNNKGDGSSPNPNDLTFEDRKDLVSSVSPTGLRYNYTGYRVFHYFVTDGDGNAEQDFVVDSCHHVLWNTDQIGPSANDGPTISHNFTVSQETDTAYDTSFPATTESIYGEWERLPMGNLGLLPGDYECKVILTEESFHGSGLAGGWALAMSADVQFTITDPTTSEPEINVTPNLYIFANTVSNQTRLTQFTLQNTGLASLSLTAAPGATLINNDHSAFSIQTFPDTTILPDDQTTFIVAFTPAAPGNYTATLEIRSNDASTPIAQITISGRGTPQDEEDNCGCNASNGPVTTILWYLLLTVPLILRGGRVPPQKKTSRRRP